MSPRARGAVICPFLAQEGGTGYCLSQSEEVEELNAQYVGSFCLKSRHLTCPRFTRADPAARRAARARAAAGRGGEAVAPERASPPSAPSRPDRSPKSRAGLPESRVPGRMGPPRPSQQMPVPTITHPSNGSRVSVPVTLDGTSNPGGGVEIFDGKRSIGITLVDDTGHWSITLHAIPPGSHRLRAQSLEEGSDRSRSSLPLVVVVEQVPLAADASELGVPLSGKDGQSVSVPAPGNRAAPPENGRQDSPVGPTTRREAPAAEAAGVAKHDRVQEPLRSVRPTSTVPKAAGTSLRDGAATSKRAAPVQATPPPQPLPPARVRVSAFRVARTPAAAAFALLLVLGATILFTRARGTASLHLQPTSVAAVVKAVVTPTHLVAAPSSALPILTALGPSGVQRRHPGPVNFCWRTRAVGQRFVLTIQTGSRSTQYQSRANNSGHMANECISAKVSVGTSYIWRVRADAAGRSAQFSLWRHVRFLAIAPSRRQNAPRRPAPTSTPLPTALPTPTVQPTVPSAHHVRAKSRPVVHAPIKKRPAVKRAASRRAHRPKPVIIPTSTPRPTPKPRPTAKPTAQPTVKPTEKPKPTPTVTPEVQTCATPPNC